MTFSPYSYKGQKVGHVSFQNSILFFFGNRWASKDLLNEAFPSLNFYFLKQIHSGSIIHANSEPQEADGHFTQQKNIALCIQTADCLPVLFCQQNWIFALHMGWRGFCNQLFKASLHVLKEKNITHQPILAALGPHILKDSFEVDEDVKDKILSSQEISINNSRYFNRKNNKFYVDLSLILNHQFEKKLKVSLESFQQDTFTNYEFHSYRREKQQSGRNISFIAKLS